MHRLLVEQLVAQLQHTVWQWFYHKAPFSKFIASNLAVKMWFWFGTWHTKAQLETKLFYDKTLFYEACYFKLKEG